MTVQLRDVTHDYPQSDYPEPERINPYEDWEKSTRPEWQKKKEKSGKILPLWQPVYVELAPKKKSEIREAVKALIGAVDKTSLILPEDTYTLFCELLKSLDANKDYERHIRFFVFRPETDAYTRKAGKTVLPYRVLHVGTAIPAEFAERFLGRADAELTEKPDKAKRHDRVRPNSPVVTGVIDGVIGFANERFRDRETSTRIRNFWAQGIVRMTARKPNIGNDLTKSDIDEFLKEQQDELAIYQKFYENLGIPVLPSRHDPIPYDADSPDNGPRSAEILYDPAYRRPPGFAWTHGTHVLDIAAGFPMDQPEIPNRPIMAVQLPELATLETWGARLDLYILIAAHRLLHWADNFTHDDDSVGPVPIVINISYGVAAGPKDGQGFIERELARLARLRTEGGAPTYFVFPAGNFYRSQTHAAAALEKNESFDVTWRLQPADRSVSFLEIWLRRLNCAEFEIRFPDGVVLGDTIDSNFAVKDIVRNNVTVGRLYRQTINERTRLLVAMTPTINDDDAAPRWVFPGAYGISITNTSELQIGVTIDVQRDDTPSQFPAYGRQSYLDSPDVDSFDPETHDWTMPKPGSRTVMRERTLSAFSTTPVKECIVVGGTFDRDNYADAALYSSSGPVTFRAGPDVSAVSDESRTHAGRLAAGFMSSSAAVANGTSVAAPATTRRIVHAMSMGVEHRDIVSAILEGGTTLPGQDARLGHGTIRFEATAGRPNRRWPS